MGVKTHITLQEVNNTFKSYNFTSITPTTTGIMDTTYIVDSLTNSYILKRYERDLKIKVIKDAKLLKELKSAGLNIATLLDAKDGWYIYEKLRGQEPKNIQTYHIQALARFLAKMHKFTNKKSIGIDFIQKKDINKIFSFLKINSFYHYKKYESLKHLTLSNDGIIHGDIFKDNTVFDSKKIGVFDFSDSGNGSFAFDAGVTLFGFDIDAKSKLFINLFLNTYNQIAVKKLSYKEVIKNIKLASEYYGLKRVFRENKI